MTARTDKMSAGKSHAKYMRQYRKKKRLEEDNSQRSNNVPKRRKTNAEYMRDYRKSVDKQPTKSNAEYMRDYRKRKAQEKNTTSIYVNSPYTYSNHNLANEYFQKHFINVE
jgi:arginine deiminase